MSLVEETAEEEMFPDHDYCPNAYQDFSSYCTVLGSESTLCKDMCSPPVSRYGVTIVQVIRKDLNLEQYIMS